MANNKCVQVFEGDREREGIRGREGEKDAANADRIRVTALPAVREVGHLAFTVTVRRR